MNKNQIQMKCSHCGSTNVTRDAAVAWNMDYQTWELITVFDHSDCNDCGGECSLVEEEIDVI